MSPRIARPLLAGFVLALAACGGGSGSKSSSELALGAKAVVTHSQIASGDQKAATTTLGTRCSRSEGPSDSRKAGSPSTRRTRATAVRLDFGTRTGGRGDQAFADVGLEDHDAT